MGRITIDDLRAFIVAAGEKTFTEAARKIGTSNQNLSKSIRRLEENIGFDLFSRTTRSVKLTSRGKIYLYNARISIDLLEDAQKNIAQENDLAGSVVISAPRILHQSLLDALCPVLREFPELNPELRTDGVAADINISMGQEPNKEKKIAETSYRLYAAPSYLQQLKPILTIDDLAGKTIAHRTSTGIHDWTFIHNETPLNYALRPKLVLDNELAVIAACVYGLGITNLPDRAVAPFVRQMSLKEVQLEGPRGQTADIFATARDEAPPRAEVVFNAISTYLKEVPESPVSPRRKRFSLSPQLLAPRLFISRSQRP